MCIPKTNRSFEVAARTNGHAKLPVVAFFPQLTANLRTLIAGGLLLASLTAPLQSHAVPLNASALAGTDTVSFMTARNSVSMLPAGDAKLRVDSDFLEADIADFAAQRGQHDAGKQKAARLTELGSFSVGNMTPSDAPLATVDDRDSTTFGGSTAAAGMPVMVIVWLFGIGLIGIGTVGRRKQSKR